MNNTRRSFVYVAAALSAALLAALFIPTAPSTASVAAVVPVAFTEDAGALSDSPLIALAQRDPMAITRLGLERYERDVREYSCVFLKQERLNGKLSPLQRIEVRYREAPLSVYMLWQENADGAKRALYIDTPEFVDDDGQKAARIEPAGAVVRLFVSDIMMPIHGDEARKASRRSIDEFGFKSTTRLLNSINTRAAQAGVLDYRYAGVGEVDARPTLVFIRNLPYTGPDGPYPDARLVLHVDQEWLLPTAVYSYADPEGKELLGSYVLIKVRLNPGLSDAAFRF